MLAPDVRWGAVIMPLLGLDAVEGREEVVELLRHVMPEHLADFRAEPGRLTDVGDSVVVETNYSGRGRTSDLPVAVTAWTVYRFRDGLLAWREDYGTEAEALEAAGADDGPQPPTSPSRG